MARKPIYLLDRALERAKARENYYKNRQPTDTTTVEARNLKSVYYRSLLLKNGVEHQVFRVGVNTDALTKLGATEAAITLLGLLAEPPEGVTPLKVRGSGMRPSRAFWYKGAATPSARKTPWGSRVIKYYDTQNGRSHFSVPISDATGAFDAKDVVTKFNTLFNLKDGSHKELLGTSNGRAWLELEEAAQSFYN